MKQCTILTTALSILLLSTFLSAKEPTDDYIAIRETARKLGDTEEGKAYEKQFGKDFAPSMQEALKTCTQGTTPPYKVNIVYVIAQDGTVERTIPDPEQPVSICAAEKIKGTKLSPPPKAGWLVSVSIEIHE